MKLSANNGLTWLLLVLVFTPLCVIFIPLSATIGVMIALVVLLVGLYPRKASDEHSAP